MTVHRILDQIYICVESWIYCCETSVFSQQKKCEYRAVMAGQHVGTIVGLWEPTWGIGSPRTPREAARSRPTGLWRSAGRCGGA